jgi:hypothetical protein
MPIKVTCPKCGGVLHAPDDAGGKRGRCPTCGTVLNIPLAQGSSMGGMGGGGMGGGGSPGFPPSPGSEMGFGNKPKRQMLDDDEPPPVSAPLPRTSGPVGGPGLRGGGLSGGGPSPLNFADEPRATAARPAPEPRRAPPAAGPGQPVGRPPMPRPAPAAGPGDDEPIEDQGRGWKKVRSGLGVVRLGVVLMVLSPFALTGLAVYEKTNPLPNQNPGYLGVKDFPSGTEIYLGAAVAPLVLGLLLVLFGRMRVARAPKSSFAKGAAWAASSATLLAVAAVVAAAVPSGIGIANGLAPGHFQPKNDENGVVERFGLATAISAAVVAEVWFVFALGRMGAALRSPVLAGRATRFAVLAGLLVILGAAAGVGYFVYLNEFLMWWAANAKPHWDKLDEGFKPAVRYGAVAAAAVLVGFCYLRLLGGARKAIREWQEQHPVAV